MTRSTNTISDVITGATLSLHSATSGAATVSFNNDKTAVNTEIEAFVTSANDSLTTLKNLMDRNNSGELAGNTFIRQIQREIKGFLTGTSSSPGATITRLSDIGISITQTGTLSLDSAELDSKLGSSFSEIITMFSANTDQQTDAGDANRGVAGDITKYIKDLQSSAGYFTKRVDTINENINGYNSDLVDLQARMEKLQERYTLQFSAMQKIVNEMNTLRDGLKSTFENLPYNNRDN